MFLLGWAALFCNLILFAYITNEVTELFHLPDKDGTKLLAYIVLQNVLILLTVILVPTGHSNSQIKDHTKRQNHIAAALQRISEDVEIEFDVNQNLFIHFECYCSF